MQNTKLSAILLRKAKEKYYLLQLNNLINLISLIIWKIYHVDYQLVKLYMKFLNITLNSFVLLEELEKKKQILLKDKIIPLILTKLLLLDVNYMLVKNLSLLRLTVKLLQVLLPHF